MNNLQNSTESVSHLKPRDTQKEVAALENLPDQAATSPFSTTYHKYHDRREREEKEAAKLNKNNWYKIDDTPSYQENLVNFKKRGIIVYSHGFSKFHNRYKIIHLNPEYSESLDKSLSEGVQ